MSRVNTGLACPECDHVGVTSELFQVVPGVLTQCPKDSDHKWSDTVALRNAKPRMLKMAPKPAAIQPNHVQMSITVPQSTEAALRARYGDSLSASLMGVLQMCTEEDFLVLNTSELDRIQARLGFRPKDSGELFGRIFAMGEEITSLRLEIMRLTRMVSARNGSNASAVILDLGNELQKAVATAHGSGVDVESMLAEYLKVSLQNGWITGV